MIIYDKDNHQILSKACLNCADPYFQPAHSSLPTVGCCSYSPVISLFEIHQMLKLDDRDFFFHHIFNNTNATINDYNIVIHANVNPLFETENTDHLSSIKTSDLKLSYSICQFFKMNKGCSLLPSYKNATCRSFICSTVESQMDTYEQKDLSEWTRSIQLETKTFNDTHQNILQKRGITLSRNVEDVLFYLEQI
ncbi:hypothetical protein [Alkalihalobacterium elongatum]|uniref:hypothetical protein n=1 Tax=Alkalihalobacterium elongatum TaxID=2675466 RepID=UPI001C1F70B6|nr:hypothetical protein [Alkalihalobacterium elongatum]